MTATADDLARRLVAAPGFRWMPGMLTVDTSTGGTQRLFVHDDAHWHAHAHATTWLRIGHIALQSRFVPAISHDDPATEGCLLRLAREVYPGTVQLFVDGDRGVVLVGDGHAARTYSCPTLGEALAHAILAAGEVRDA